MALTVVGVDIGNSTTEASAAVVATDGSTTFRGAALTATTGVKGTPRNVDGVAQAVVRALEASAVRLADLDLVLLNEATPVISGMAMETITETIITESTMIGHDPRTPGGRGLGVGLTVAFDALAQTPSGTEVIVVVPRNVDFEDAARGINAAAAQGLTVCGVILGNDDAVLVANRLDSVVPVIDEVSRIDAVPLGMLAAVEVAAPGNSIRTLSNAYGLATIFDLDAAATKVISPVARALTGNRSAVVVRTPAGDVADRSIPAGSLELSGVHKRATVDVSRGAPEIMSAVERVAPLADVAGEAGTNTGGMIANVRHSMAELSGHALADVCIQDLLAVDTFVPQEVRGGVAGEVALENAVALAAMVRTRESGMRAVADEVRARLRAAGADSVDVMVGGVEAEMAALGALTTPGTDKPLVVLDLGGGSTDAALLAVDGGISTVHLAGAGDLVTKLIDAELGLDNLELAEDIKRSPLGKAESFFHVRLENGTVMFFEKPLPAASFARVVTLAEYGMNAIPTRHSMDRVRLVRRAAKERVFVVNALRALRAIAPGGDLRQIGFVVLLGGCALDFEIPELIADALAPFGIVCGTGNVRGSEGPRNAVATGLVASHARLVGAGLSA
ncbi:diol dehydratase reactivase subunit alpha [Mycolicibacterium peregrinum]|uniref:diol dehydratase reactivase subunit alpha n=1 Tax=Mycolicibacterium peregrinum TaxID=43304 RepID=UPI0006D83CC3|nr:diol dehydratase reactivase subunit alpha [Mycolicibacterium peregrinum]MCV7203478.1 diol dehydratase reactivase subunit alpha [Mycolicibacterium peregrinum]ORW58974.1 diol dehydratase reactivase subunit alpha [Mycolicibacterium peregrinum]OWM08281.1 diol dehydratase reactivase subunit alpha [Mycolicibacterium peregrinum]